MQIKIVVIVIKINFLQYKYYFIKTFCHDYVASRLLASERELWLNAVKVLTQIQQ